MRAKMIYKRPSVNPNKVVVIFEIPSTVWADHINLVGDFNDWDRNNLPFRQSRQENWQVEVELDAGREYRFRYLFDGGHWGYDWHSDKSLPDATGGYDSIVIAEFPQAI
jgi:1,4-alpha-glucan branching enzyme